MSSCLTHITFPATLRTREEEVGPKARHHALGPRVTNREGLPCSPEAVAYFLHGRLQLYPEHREGEQAQDQHTARGVWREGWGVREQAALAGKSGKWGHLGGCPVQVSRRPLIAQVLSSPQDTLKSLAAGALCQHESAWYQFPSSHDMLNSNHDTHQPW